MGVYLQKYEWAELTAIKTKDKDRQQGLQEIWKWLAKLTQILGSTK